jgi:hypothetical protein
VRRQLVTANPSDDWTRHPELARLIAELGDPIAGYSPDLRPALWVIGLASAAIVLALSLPLGFAIRLWTAWLSALALAFGISMLWPALMSLGYRVCPAGLAVISWHRVERCRWPEIESLRVLQRTQTMGGWTLAGSGSLSAMVEMRGRKRFELKWLTAPSAAFIERETYRAMLPRVQEALDAGRSVAFGEVAVAREGLNHKRTLVPWEEIDRIEFRHTVIVRKRDGSSVYVFDVPNLGLFMDVANARLSTGRFVLPTIPPA